ARYGVTGNNVPIVDTAKAYSRYQTFHRAVLAGVIASCHDLSDGGLVVAAAESAFAGDYGMAIDLGRVLWKGEPAGKNDAALLFSESASRHLVTVHHENRERFEKIMTGNCFASIGEVTAEPVLAITGLSGGMVVRADLTNLKNSWQSTLKDL
ncbi:MAG TPA: AIR synthase-related protein, partial [Geobacteraceae bacterium]|nr:AIR synthase-related protein [Geobacteraceae bacterium]